MLSGAVVIALALGVYLQRVAGMLLVDAERLPSSARRVLDALPLTIITAVIALTTVAEDGELVVDPRMAGVAVAGLCASRRLPMLVAVFAAAATTAVLRALT